MKVEGKYILQIYIWFDSTIDRATCLLFLFLCLFVFNLRK